MWGINMNKQRNIVLIADRIENHNSISIESTTLELVEDTYFVCLYNSLKEINPNVIHYENPQIFLKNINKHKNDVVLSVWSGEKTRNRKALIPSICEAYNIPYVGADSYLQIISADKYLSKKVCTKFNIKSSNDILITQKKDCWMLDRLKYPVVFKPNLEGGSIGIFKENLAENFESAKKVCEKLLEFYCPIIVEEYLIGEEVSVCIAGINNIIDVFQVIQHKLGQQKFFTKEIFSAEIKKMHKTTRTLELANDILPKTEKEKLINLFNNLGKAEVMRIDGRIYNNNFYLIELTPDCSLKIKGSMSLAFEQSGYTYTDMLRKLIANSIHSWVNQNAKR